MAVKPFDWKGNGKTLVRWLPVAAAAALIIWWAAGYYGDQVFQFDNRTYKLAAEQGDTITYEQSPGTAQIVVRTLPGMKEVLIYGEWYTVRELQDEMIEVQYPNGTIKLLNYRYGYPEELDENGEWTAAFPLIAYTGYGRQVAPGEEYFHPVEIVDVTAPNLEPRGVPAFFVLAVLVFVAGWCNFRYDGFVRLSYRLSYGLWVEDPEPTDMAYGMAKIGGIVMMLLSLYVFYLSL